MPIILFSATKEISGNQKKLNLQNFIGFPENSTNEEIVKRNITIFHGSSVKVSKDGLIFLLDHEEMNKDDTIVVGSIISNFPADVPHNIDLLALLENINVSKISYHQFTTRWLLYTMKKIPLFLLSHTGIFLDLHSQFYKISDDQSSIQTENLKLEDPQSNMNPISTEITKTYLEVSKNSIEINEALINSLESMKKTLDEKSWLNFDADVIVIFWGKGDVEIRYLLDFLTLTRKYYAERLSFIPQYYYKFFLTLIERFKSYNIVPDLSAFQDLRSFPKRIYEPEIWNQLAQQFFTHGQELMKLYFSVAESDPNNQYAVSAEKFYEIALQCARNTNTVTRELLGSAVNLAVLKLRQEDFIKATQMFQLTFALYNSFKLQISLEMLKSALQSAIRTSFEYYSTAKILAREKKAVGFYISQALYYILQAYSISFEQKIPIAREITEQLRSIKTLMLKTDTLVSMTTDIDTFLTKPQKNKADELEKTLMHAGEPKPLLLITVDEGGIPMYDYMFSEEDTLPKVEILAGFLTAMATFAQAEIGRGTLREFRAAGADILVESKSNFTSFLLVQNPHANTKAKLKEFADRFEQRFSLEIKNFVGAMVFSDADEFVKEIFILG